MMPAQNRPPLKDNLSPYEQKVLDCTRVARVVKGGRRFRFRALVALGDKAGKIGIGVAKGSDVAKAVAKAVNVAKKEMFKITITESQSIPHDVLAKVGGAKILLKPAREGTGLIAGSVTRQILELAGYSNIYSKSLGNSNKVNLSSAVFAALKQLVPESDWHLKQVSLQEKASKKETTS